jgi:hypothetical protein
MPARFMERSMGTEACMGECGWVGGWVCWWVGGGLSWGGVGAACGMCVMREEDGGPTAGDEWGVGA